MSKGILLLIRLKLGFYQEGDAKKLQYLFANFTDNRTPYRDGEVEYIPLGCEIETFDDDIAKSHTQTLKLSNAGNRLSNIISRYSYFIEGTARIIQIEADSNQIIKTTNNVKLDRTYLISQFKEFDGKELKIELSTPLFFDVKMPPFDIRELCCYEFGDRNCGYVGTATSCDKTYTSCKKLRNISHFPGSINDED